MKAKYYSEVVHNGPSDDAPYLGLPTVFIMQLCHVPVWLANYQ